MKVLYIEDSDRDWVKLSSILKEEGIHTIRAKSYSEACETIKEEDPDVIVVDLELFDEKGLPQEIQGEDIVSLLNKEFPNKPIFILSKYINRCIPYLGCYSKGDIFNSKEGADMFIHQLKQAVEHRKGGLQEPLMPSKQWKRKWAKEWTNLKNSSDFKAVMEKVSEEALKDIELLESGKLEGSYRAYRGTKTFFDVLVSRRILSYSFIKFTKEPGIVWWKLEDFLNMEENAIKNYFFEVGLAWGSIINRKTLLQEEVEWLRNIGVMV